MCAFIMYTGIVVNVVHGYTTVVRRTMVVYEYDACDNRDGLVDRKSPSR